MTGKPIINAGVNVKPFTHVQWCILAAVFLTLAKGCSSTQTSPIPVSQNKYRISSLMPREKRDVRESVAVYESSWPKGRIFQVVSLAFSPDGKFLASAGYRPGGRLRPKLQIFDTQTGKSIRTVSGHPIRNLAFLPRSNLLVSGGPKIKVWDHARGQLKIVLPTAATSLAVSADGKWLATADSDRNSVGIWDTRTWKRRHLAGFRAEVGNLVFSPDSKRVLSSTNLSLEVATGRVLHDPTGTSYGVFTPQNIPISSDNSMAAEWRNTNQGQQVQLRVLDRQTDKVLWNSTTTLKNHVSTSEAGLAFSPDGRILAATHFSDTNSPAGVLVNLWNARTGQLEAEIRRDRADDPLGAVVLAFSSDSKMLAIGDIGVGHATKLVKLD